MDSNRRLWYYGVIFVSIILMGTLLLDSWGLAIGSRNLNFNADCSNNPSDDILYNLPLWLIIISAINFIPMLFLLFAFIVYVIMLTVYKIINFKFETYKTVCMLCVLTYMLVTVILTVWGIYVLCITSSKCQYNVTNWNNLYVMSILTLCYHIILLITMTILIYGGECVAIVSMYSCMFCDELCCICLHNLCSSDGE